MIKTAGTVFIIRIVGASLLLLSNVYMARTLNISDYGLVNFILAFSSIATLITVSGSNKLLTKEISRLDSTEKNKQNILYYLGAFNIVVFLPLALLLIVLVLHYKQESNYLIIFTAIIVTLVSIKSINDGYLIGDSKSIIVAMLDNIVRPALTIVMIYFTSTIINITLASVLTILSLMFFGLIVLQFFSVKPGFPSYRPTINDFKEWRTESYPFLLISISLILQNNISIFLLGVLSDKENVALFSVASRMSAIILFAIAATTHVYMPLISKLYKEGAINKIDSNIKMVSVVVGIFGLIIGLLLLFLSKHLLLLFGEEYLAAQFTFYILIAATIVAAISGPVGSIMSMTDNARISASIMMQATILSLILNLILIPIWDIRGAALSTLISITYWNVKLLIIVNKRLGIRSGLIGLTIFKRVHQ